MSEQEFQHIELRRTGNVVTCVLNRPERRNAVNDVMHQELVAMFQLLARDEAVHAPAWAPPAAPAPASTPPAPAEGD